MTQKEKKGKEEELKKRIFFNFEIAARQDWLLLLQWNADR
jgi:hypothetical protein